MTTPDKNFDSGIGVLRRAVAQGRRDLMARELARVQAARRQNTRNIALTLLVVVVVIVLMLLVCIMVARAEYGDRNQHNGTDRSSGSSSVGGPASDLCGTECGNATVFIPDGRDVAAYASRTGWRESYPSSQAAFNGF